MAGRDQDDASVTTPAFLTGDEETRPPPWASKVARVRTWVPPGGKAPAEPPPEPVAAAPQPSLEDEASRTGARAEEPAPAAEHEDTDPGAADPAEPTEPAALTEPAEPTDCPVCEETRREAAAERDELLDRLMDPYLGAAAELGLAADELASSFNDDVVTLATRLAAAIVQREVSVDRELLVANLDRAIAIAGPVTELTVRCHPGDAERLREVAPGLAESASGRAVDVTVRPSPDVEPGACLLLFEQGIVDARWTAQLERLAEAVRGALANQPDAQEDDGEAD